MATTNTKLTFKGNPLKVQGPSLTVGQKAPPFTLTANDMSDVKSSSFAGKVLVLSVVPSLDTPVCSIQTKHFNKEATELSKDVAILTVSMDLPFAQARWCGAEGVKNVVTASDYKHRFFGKDYGVLLEDLGLLARAVFVIDKTGVVQYVQYVDEMTTEPNYDEALKKVRELL